MNIERDFIVSQDFIVGREISKPIGPITYEEAWPIIQDALKEGWQEFSEFSINIFFNDCFEKGTKVWVESRKCFPRYNVIGSCAVDAEPGDTAYLVLSRTYDQREEK